MIMISHASIILFVDSFPLVNFALRCCTKKERELSNR